MHPAPWALVLNGAAAGCDASPRATCGHCWTASGAPAAGNQAYKFAQAVLRLGAEADLSTASPVAGLKKPHKDECAGANTNRRRTAARLAVRPTRSVIRSALFVKLLVADRAAPRRGRRHAAGRAARRHMDVSRRADEERQAAYRAAVAAGRWPSSKQQPRISGRLCFQHTATKPLSGFHQRQASPRRTCRPSPTGRCMT